MSSIGRCSDERGKSHNICHADLSTGALAKVEASAKEDHRGHGTFSAVLTETVWALMYNRYDKDSIL